LVISRGQAYASEILDELKKADLIVVEGTIYPLLNRLKNSGYLSYDWEESPNGPPRKYYSLTKAGQSALELMSQNWDKLHGSIRHLRKNLNNKIN
jgi:PadR family transcriptional regulator, regulatory protein PadR